MAGLALHDILDTVLAVSAIITALAAIVMMILVYLQFRDMNKNILSQTYQNIYERMIEIDRFFIDNPELKRYFYYNEPIGDNDRESIGKLHSIAEMMVDYFDSVYYQKECMKKEAFDAKAFYFGDICNNSPVLRDYLALPGLDRWYSERFLTFLRANAIAAADFLKVVPKEQLAMKLLISTERGQ